MGLPVRTFAERFKGLLEQREMSTYEFIRRSGMCATTVYAYARGEVEPGMNSLKTIQRTLGCSWTDLLGEEEMWD